MNTANANIKATLCRDPSRKGFRALVTMPDMKGRFICAYPTEQVEVVPATQADLTWIMSCLGVEVTRGVDKVCEKFRKEICAFPDGDLCYDEATDKGFFKLIPNEK